MQAMSCDCCSLALSWKLGRALVPVQALLMQEPLLQKLHEVQPSPAIKSLYAHSEDYYIALMSSSHAAIILSNVHDQHVTSTL